MEVIVQYASTVINMFSLETWLLLTAFFIFIMVSLIYPKPILKSKLLFVFMFAIIIILYWLVYL